MKIKSFYFLLSFFEGENKGVSIIQLRMNNSTALSIKEIDGKRLYYCFLAGARNLFDNQKELNKLNVYPVPDADTGTNLASTFQSIIDNVIPVSHVRETSVAIAQAALTGARGNSGIIIAQFLYGFSNEMGSSGTLTVSDFADQLRKAVKYAYEAIANPMEGTIITVMKDWSEAVYKMKDNTDNFLELFTQSLHNARASLRETAKMMEKLAKSKIVDAGAQGFIYFLEGILAFFTEKNIRSLFMPRIVIASDEVYDNHDAITFRYCTEAFLNNLSCSVNDIRSLLAPLGDSIVVAGSIERMRVHIHCDEPASIFALLARFGSIVSQKVDDMVQQHAISHNRKAAIGLVADSCCDLPAELLDKYQITLLPLILHAGGNQYLDKITITPQLFYPLLDVKGEYPSTSQPSTKDTVNKLSYLSTHYDSLVVLNMSSQLSGTHSSTLQASKTVVAENSKVISVIDTKTMSGAQGLLMLRAAKAVENGMSHSELVENISKWQEGSITMVAVKTLKYFVRHGRVSKTEGFIGKILNLKPVVSIDAEGKACKFGKSFSRAASLKLIIENAAQKAQERKIHSYAVLYTNEGERPYAQDFANKLTQRLGMKPVYIMSASPVACVSAGIGSIVFSAIFE